MNIHFADRKTENIVRILRFRESSATRWPSTSFFSHSEEYELFPFVDLWQNRTLSTSISVSHSRREFPTRVWHWISEFGISESGTELCPEFAFLGHFPLTVFLLLLFPFLWSDVRFLFVCVFVLSYRLFEW